MKRPSAIAKLAITAFALTLIVTAAACSTEHAKDSDNDKVDTLNISASAPQPTFTRNFNPFSPTSKKSPGINYFYEPLVRVNRSDSNKIEPWLAKSFSYSHGGKTLTFKLRDDVKFSNGKPLTAEDVKYTLELPSKVNGLGSAPIPNLKNVTTPDKHTAVVHYTKPELHDLANYGDDPRLIVPAQLWKRHDPVKWTNKSPVGTGAFTLDSFGTQSIKLKARDDYWHGKFHGVKYVNMRSFGSEESGRKMVLKNQLSWATMAWQGYQDDFVDKDPKNNHYWNTYNTNGGYKGVIFNTKKAPTDNVHVRRALYAAINSDNVIKLFDDGDRKANPAGLSEVWRDYLPSRLRHAHHKQDIRKARSELEASGYKVSNGKLTKDGKSYPLSLKVNADYNSHTAFAAGLHSQWKESLGLNISIKKTPGDQFGEYEQDGDFQMLFDYINGGNDIWSVLDNQLGGSHVRPLGTSASGNYGRYKNPKVDDLLDRMAGTRDSTELEKYVRHIANIAVRDVPYGAVVGGASYIEVNATDWTGWPDPDTSQYVPHTLWPVDPTVVIQHLKPKSSS